MNSPLHNTYFLMRHGRSEANDAQIINSSVESGTAENHLTEEGKKQVELSIEKAKTEYSLDSNTIILTSDFARTMETAQVVQKVLNVPEIETCEKLRERSFGAYDGTSSLNYKKIWQAELDNTALNDECEVESVDAVEKRVLECVRDLESRYTGKNIFLISHGDTLQILQVSLQGLSPNQHRSVVSMQNAEIRKVNAKI